MVGTRIYNLIVLGYVRQHQSLIEELVRCLRILIRALLLSSNHIIALKHLTVSVRRVADPFSRNNQFETQFIALRLDHNIYRFQASKSSTKHINKYFNRLACTKMYS